MRKRKQSDDDALFAAFALLTADTQTHLADIARQYLSGAVRVWTVQTAMTDALLGAHTHAAYLGRRLAGVVDPLNRADNHFGQTAAWSQAEYLARLVADLQSNRYPLGSDGSLPNDLMNRLRWYALRLRGTADQAWTMALPHGAQVNWITTAAESCGGCIDLQASNPHDAATLTIFPGSGDTPCALGCKCYLEMVGGGSGFMAA